MNNKFSALLVSSLLALSFSTSAAEFEVGQKDKQFTQATLTIKKGDTVKFTNEDPFSHNIYSLSEISTFDLGSFPKGNSKSVTFDKAGIVDVGCAVHMSMAMVITVE